MMMQVVVLHMLLFFIVYSSPPLVVIQKRFKERGFVVLRWKVQKTAERERRRGGVV
jgi:hypothetical protein